MNHNDIFIHTLPNGLRMVHVATPSRVGWCGLAINAGSRDDPHGKYGLAHFVEHTIFKGTTHRRSCHIINRMETVGGELNAYTTKEGTMLYSVFPGEHTARAIELIADLVAFSTFPESELIREMDVVLEEVDSYRDTPAEAVADDFEDIIFAGSALGHNILGIEADLKTVTTTDCLNYLKTMYVPENMVFFSVGNQQPERVFALAQKHFGILNHSLSRVPRQAPPTVEPQHKHIDLGLHQAHTIVGARTMDLHDDRRFAMALLNNILAGPGMNSLLNVSLREKRGWVYTVESNLSTFTDCGMLQIYLGCDSSHVNKSVRIIENTITDLAENPISHRKLDAWKRQYCGQLLVASSTAEFVAMNAGKTMLYRNHVTTLNEVMQRIEALTPSELMEAAQIIAPHNCSTLTFS